MAGIHMLGAGLGLAAAGEDEPVAVDQRNPDAGPIGQIGRGEDPIVPAIAMTAGLSPLDTGV